MKKKVVIGLVLMASLFFAAYAKLAIAEAKPPKKAEVVRDEYGIPRITAPTNEKLFELFGYTVAEDRLWQLEYNKRNARGTLAEIFGASLLPADQGRRLFGYSEEEYMSIFNSLRQETRKILQAYVDGINRRIDEVMANRDTLLPFEFKYLGIEPSRWTVTDSLACNSASFRSFGTNGGTELSKLDVLEKLIDRYGEVTAYGMFNDLYWVNDQDAPTYINKEMVDKAKKFSSAKEIARYAKGFSNVEKASKHYEKLLLTMKELGMPMFVDSASFAWAVSGKQTATGYPMLAGNPQMGFGYPGIVYEVHLRGGSGFNVAGHNAVGAVNVSIGHNEDIAWSLMVGMGDNVDIYAETLNPDNREQYLYRGKWIDMEKRVETFMVAGESPVTMTIYRTIHGPVISPDPFNPDDPSVTQVYTWKYAHWLLEPKTTDAFLTMMRARKLQDFEDGLKIFRSSLHHIYADRAGNIAYWQAGLVPIRPEGTDFRLPLLGTGEHEWTGEFRVMPKAVNPEKGYVCGWNNKSSPEFNNPDSSMFGKFHRALWLESALQDSKEITLEDMRRIQLMMGSVGSHGVTPTEVDGAGIYIRNIMPHLSNAITKVPDTDPYCERLKDALYALKNWDGRAMEDAITSTTLKVAQIVFDNWVTFMLKNTFTDEFGGIVSFDKFSHDKFSMLVHALDGPLSSIPPSRNYFDNISSLGVIETVDDIVVKSMKETIDKLTAQFGTSDMSQWITPRPKTIVKHPLIGVIMTFPTQNSGTYSFIAELKPKGIEGMSRWPYGSSGFIGMDDSGKPVYDNPHLFDMLGLYEGYDYQPMFLGKKLKAMKQLQ